MTRADAATMRHTAAAHRTLVATEARTRSSDTVRPPGPPGPRPPTDLHRLDLISTSCDAASRAISTIAAIVEPLDTREADLLRDLVATLDTAEAWVWCAAQTSEGLVPEEVSVQIGREALSVLVSIVRHLGGHPGLPTLLTCPHCRCLTVAPRPRHPDILTCTNPSCAPAPHTWSLRRSEWWENFPELLA